MTRISRYGLKDHIPAEIKRAVRQRCYFGCVKCGKAIYQYHHFDPPFEDAREHRSQGITLLCGACHDEVTRGLWSSELVVQCDRNPYCASRDPSRFLNLQAPLDLLVGSILLSGTGDLLTIDGETLLRFDAVDGEGMALSATILGDDGTPVVRIDRNELVVCAPAWDVATVGRKTSIRRGPRDVVLEFVVHPPHGLHLNRLDLAYRGVGLVSDGKGRTELTIAGRPAPAILGIPKDYVIHVGGSIETVGESLQITGGFAAVPFPPSRLAQLAREGAFRQLARELRETTLHVVRHQDVWCVQIERGTWKLGVFEEARAWAVGMSALVPGLRTIVHHIDGSLEFVPSWR